jgi:AraC-like DNA-binding protein
MDNAAASPVAPRQASERFMWLTPDRLLYVGLLGAPAARTLGSVTVYLAADGATRFRAQGGAWQCGRMAVVQPYVPHQVATDGRLVQVLKIEAETVNLQALPPPLLASGVVDDAAFVARVHAVVREMHAQGRDFDLAAADFDRLFFGGPLTRRCVDPRIQRVIDAIKRDPAVMAAAEDCAQSVHLSFSRFLHLFKQDVGAPFRSFRTWKRARSLLHYVNRDANLAHVALDTGYPDSTHFSHSIRQVYGLKPKDIFAGSRRLAIYSSEPRAT